MLSDDYAVTLYFQLNVRTALYTLPLHEKFYKKLYSIFTLSRKRKAQHDNDWCLTCDQGKVKQGQIGNNLKNNDALCTHYSDEKSTNIQVPKVVSYQQY